jgi:hypothetical protein
VRSLQLEKKKEKNKEIIKHKKQQKLKRNKTKKPGHGRSWCVVCVS